MEFLPSEIEEYSIRHSKPESAILNELNRETHAKVLMPRMLSGHLQGKFLEMISCMIQPKAILEIGTYTGYSAICLAKGLTKEGILHTIDLNEELEEMVKKYLAKAGIENCVRQHIGKALEVIPTIKETFDIVFIDADKENYLNYYTLVFDKIHIGGFVIVDNVLWSGKVTMPEDKMDKETRAIDAFNKFITNDKRVENVLLPIRDGLMIVRKISS